LNCRIGDDLHVLATAIRCGASVIVTLDPGDFPAKTLGKFSIEAQRQLVNEEEQGLIKTVVALREFATL